MLRVLPVVLSLALSDPLHVAVTTGFAEALQATFLAAVPFALLGFVVLLFPLAGSIAWLVAGRPQRPPGQRPLRPRGPDDDPDFLRKL